MRTIALSTYMAISFMFQNVVDSTSMQFYASLDLNDFWKYSWVLRWQNINVEYIVGELFDKYKIVHNFIFRGIYKWVFSECFISRGASDLCEVSNCIWAKIFLKCYFHKLCIDHSRFSEGQLYCSYSIRYVQLSCHSFLTHRFKCALCHCHVIQKSYLCFYLIWIQCHYFVHCLLFPIFWNKL